MPRLALRNYYKVIWVGLCVLIMLVGFASNKNMLCSNATCEPMRSTLDNAHAMQSLNKSRGTVQPTSMPLVDFGHQFKCLEDKPALWEQRVRISDEFRDTYCHGEQMGPSGNAIASPLPIIFTYWMNGRNKQLSMLALALNTAAHFNDCIHLLVFGQPPNSTLDRISIDNERVHIHYIYHKQDPVQLALHTLDAPLYVHHSINAHAYELFCFQRWFAIAEFLNLHGYEHVFVADNDVLLLSNVTRDAAQCHRGCNTFGSVVYSIYFQLPVLREFTRFILQVFTYKPLLEAMRARFPVVSDMYLHVKFNENLSGTSKFCTSATHPKQKQGLVPRLPFAGHFYRQNFTQDEYGMVYMLPPRGNGLAKTQIKQPNLFQNLHFQGWRKKLLALC